MKFDCRYDTVSYFVFAQLFDGSAFEPFIEVDTKEKGLELIEWLKQTPALVNQLLNVSNDNANISLDLI